MRILNTWLSPGVAVWLCGAMAVGSVALAFLGPERSGDLMSRPTLLAYTVLLACGLAVSGARAATRRRFDSALLHIGCACVLAGWLAGRIAVRSSSPDKPASGYMALADGFVSSELSDGRQAIGEVPFSVRLMKFTIEHYEPSPADRDAGRTPPVKEYCSLVLITEPGQKPYAKKIRVNHPAYVRGYAIYQNSYRETVDDYNRPVLVTTLQFIRDPGVSAVYAGFVVLLAGVLLFAARVSRGLKRPAGKEASP
jgi:cytochrome c biogenesis protein ResB